jgi:hypothetical protein
MRFENIFRNFLAKIIFLLFPVKKVTANELFDLWNDGKIKKILFVRQNQGIGDMLLLTPVFRILKEAKKDYE